MPKIYTYTFSWWPNASTGMNDLENQLFTSLCEMRIGFHMTEGQFSRFRADIEDKFGGCRLLNIERIPFHEPETVT